MPVMLEKTGIREEKVSELMHRGAVCVRSDATVRDAVWKMKDAGVSSLIVEPRFKGDAYGIVTRRDIMEKAVIPGPKRFDLAARKVYEIMTKPLVTVSPGLKVKYALRLMSRDHLRRVPVFDGEKIIGMFSNADVFARLVDDRQGRQKAR